MIRFLPIAFITALFTIAIIIISQHQADSRSSGAPSGRSGAPGESNCSVSCHTGASLNAGLAAVSITSNIPSTGFIGGEIYAITATVTQAGITRFGFQISAEGSTGNNTGNWIITNTIQTQITGTNYVTHKFAGTSASGSKTWNMNWKAPCAGSDTVNFYCAFNVTNNNGFNSGDSIYLVVKGYEENVIGVADTVVNILFADKGNKFDGRDLSVSFLTSKCETRTDEYRIMAVKQVNAATFNLSTASLVPLGNYAIKSTGFPNTTISTNFGLNGKDVDGDPIRNNETYKIFVFSAAKASLATRDTMFEANGFITLTSPMVGVNNILIKDLRNAGNASDLEIEFDSPLNEGTVGEYRSILVKSSMALSFTMADANSLASNLYKTTSTGNPGTKINFSCQAGDMDSDGDTVMLNTAYKLFILTKSDGINSLVDTIQMSDSSVVLTGTVGISSISLTLKNVIIISYNGILRILTENSGNSEIAYEIYNMSGQLMNSGKFKQNDFQIDLDQNNLKSGIIKLNLNDQVFTQKFIR